MPAPPTASTGPVVVVRVAALPTRALDDTAVPASWAMVQAVLASRRRVAEAGARLADEVHGFIADPALAGARPELVALRRALHNRRRPGHRAWPGRHADLLPARFRADLTDWTVELTRSAALTRQLPDLLDAEQTRSLRALRRWSATEVFEFGLLQSSEDLLHALLRWRDQPEGIPPRAQVALRLAKYLARTVAKTSPQATFMMSGLCRWSDVPTAVQPTGRWAWRSVVEPNVPLLQALTRRLADGAAAGRLVVVTTPAADVADGRIWFAHPRRERIQGLLLTPPVRTAIDAVGAGAPLAEVGRRLAGDAAVTFGRLVEVGLFEIQPPFADQAADHLHDLRVWLGRESPAAGPLRALADALHAYPAPGTDASRRRELHRRIRTEFQAVHGPAGDTPLPARNLFRENAVFTAEPVRLGGARWRPAVADLHVIHRLLALFQHSTVVRLVAHRVVVDRYGADSRVGLLELHRELSRLAVDAEPGTAVAELAGLLLLRPGEPPDPARSTLAEVRRLHRLRHEALAALWAGPESPPHGVTVDPARVRALADGWPPWVRPAPALACFVQQVPATDGLRLVLNGVGAGHGAVRSRVHRLLAKAAPAGADPGELLGATPTPDPAGYLAEITGLFGSNVNLRSPAVDFEISHPGTVSARPPQRRIALDDLVVTPDGTTRSLRLRRRSDDREVRIAHTGMMAGSRLPRLARFLIHLFGDVPNAAAPTAQIFAGTPEHQPGAVRRHPRLSIGRVTVSRASWRVRADLVPRRAKGVDDAGYLLTLAAWFTDHRIPQRTYVTATGPAPPDTPPVPVKPIYLDLANMLLVRLFERLLREPGSVLVFTEALPQLADAPCFGPEGRHVTEYVVEIGPA
ncbi:hypothetical protein [Micromonospora fluostatini]|uniref:hypothetical protein n=1 Tax=Micromonospora sp. JCM 30529 TaxID=3421643 RepID=UPI003D183E30